MGTAFFTENAPVPEVFPVWRPAEAASSFGLRVEGTAAGEFFVLAHLGFFFLLLGCLGWAAWNIWRRTCRPQPHLKLIMEMDEERAASARPAAGISDDASGAAAWERPADWWKGGR